MDDVRQFISRVHRGRPPTRLGNDRIEPWISIPRRHTPAVLELMAREGISTRVREEGEIDDDRYEVFVMLDRVSFLGADPMLVQSILDDWLASLG